MDADAVRAFVAGLDDRTADARGLERVRVMLEALQRPDVRYLVVVIMGEGGVGIARVAGAILRAAGAPTALFGEPLDDPLLARAGTLAAAATYQLAASRPDLAEPSRREVEVALALTAYAESSQRVALLLDPGVDALLPLHAPTPDLVVVGRIAADAVERALAVVPDGRPLVAAPQSADARGPLENGARDRGIPLLLGDRDYRFDVSGATAVVEVAGERYADLPLPPGVEAWELATGVAAALGAGVLGIRMREEWIAQGVRQAGNEGPPRGSGWRDRAGDRNMGT